MKEIKIDLLENIVGGNCFVTGATLPFWWQTFHSAPTYFNKKLVEAVYCWNSRVEK